MDFPTGALQREIEVRSLDTLLEELREDRFVGVIKYENHRRGNLLLIDGEIKAATYGELGGDEALERIWNAIEGVLSVYTLDKERAEFVLKWYTDIHGFSSVSSEILDTDISVPVPDVEDLIKMLEREGMSHLMRKPQKKHIEKRAHKTPYEILQDVQVFLANLFGDFMADNIIKSHLRKLRIERGAITTEGVALLTEEICRNVFQRVMDDTRAEKESKKLKDLLAQQ
jgi:hypothetical protein